TPRIYLFHICRSGHLTRRPAASPASHKAVIERPGGPSFLGRLQFLCDLQVGTNDVQRQLVDSRWSPRVSLAELQDAVEGRPFPDVPNAVIQRAAVRVLLPTARGTWRALLRLSRCLSNKLCLVAEAVDTVVAGHVCWHGMTVGG
ncbi:hypothetical protein, partial [Streptomyces bottropensis]|uniref:hypothetical protein n=1 Tax=Streptomyces bottropensis TaxID=42235 RepID=UPI0036B2D0AA